MLSKFFKGNKKKVTPSEAADMLCSVAIQIMQSTNKQLGELIDAFSFSEEIRAQAYLEVIYVTHCLVLVVAMNSVNSTKSDDIANAYIDKAVNHFSEAHKIRDIEALHYDLALRAKAYNICYIVSSDSDISQSIKKMFIMILHQLNTNKDNPIEFLSNYVGLFESNPNTDMLKVPDFMPEINTSMLFNVMFKAAHEFMRHFQQEFSLY